MNSLNPVASTRSAWLQGFIGVLIFSASLPATRLALQGFSPLFLTAARALLAALCAGLMLIVWRQSRPDTRDWRSLCWVALGVVAGFPLLTAWALQTISAAHSVVFVALLPLSTACFAVWRAAERPKPLFWLSAAGGSLVVILFAWQTDSRVNWQGDLLMVLAIALCGLGYAEGAQLSRRLGGWQVICWALLLAAPVMSMLALCTWPDSWPNATSPAWLGLAYVAVFSMLLGFVFWYRGLAQGGIARIGQLQLLQPFLGLLLAHWLLGEVLQSAMIYASGLIVLSVWFARRYA